MQANRVSIINQKSRIGPVARAKALAGRRRKCANEATVFGVERVAPIAAIVSADFETVGKGTRERAKRSHDYQGENDYADRRNRSTGRLREADGANGQTERTKPRLLG